LLEARASGRGGEAAGGEQCLTLDLETRLEGDGRVVGALDLGGEIAGQALVFGREQGAGVESERADVVARRGAAIGLHDMAADGARFELEQLVDRGFLAGDVAGTVTGGGEQQPHLGIGAAGRGDLGEAVAGVGGAALLERIDPGADQLLGVLVGQLHRPSLRMRRGRRQCGGQLGGST